MELYLTKFEKYEPCEENLAESPKLPYVDPLFKRRLSQISKMTIEVVHNVIDGDESLKDAKLVFASFRGEIARQLKINKGIVEDAEVMPAQFSISVFNTPPAVATIALGMKAGYTAVYPAGRDFSAALSSAAAAVISGREKRVVFVYADERVPAEYEGTSSAALSEKPMAMACVLSSERTEGASEIGSLDFHSPADFMAKFSR